MIKGQRTRVENLICRLLCVVSRASSPAKSSKVQWERPAGGLEQAVATSMASSLSVSLRRAVIVR